MRWIGNAGASLRMYFGCRRGGELNRRHTPARLRPWVDGVGHRSNRGGERMEPDRYWLLLLMGAAVLVAFVIILQRIW